MLNTQTRACVFNNLSFPLQIVCIYVIHPSGLWHVLLHLHVSSLQWVTALQWAFHKKISPFIKKLFRWVAGKSPCFLASGRFSFILNRSSEATLLLTSSCPPFHNFLSFGTIEAQNCEALQDLVHRGYLDPHMLPNPRRCPAVDGIESAQWMQSAYFNSSQLYEPRCVFTVFTPLTVLWKKRKCYFQLSSVAKTFCSLPTNHSSGAAQWPAEQQQERLTGQLPWINKD